MTRDTSSPRPEPPPPHPPPDPRRRFRLIDVVLSGALPLGQGATSAR
jgi:hypothetical protein